MLIEHPWLQTVRSPHNRRAADIRIWSLCYRSHDLHDILNELPKLMLRLTEFAQRGRPDLLHNLKAVCSAWTIYARYSPKSAKMSEAKLFLARIEELKECLK